MRTCLPLGRCSAGWRGRSVNPEALPSWRPVNCQIAASKMIKSDPSFFRVLPLWLCQRAHSCRYRRVTNDYAFCGDRYCTNPLFWPFPGHSLRLNSVLASGQDSILSDRIGSLSLPLQSRKWLLTVLLSLDPEVSRPNVPNVHLNEWQVEEDAVVSLH